MEINFYFSRGKYNYKHGEMMIGIGVIPFDDPKKESIEKNICLLVCIIIIIFYH